MGVKDDILKQTQETDDMTAWGNLWDKDKEKIHTAWHPEAYLDEWLAKIKEEGDLMNDRLQDILDVFYDQPSNVIQWMPDKQHYSWGLIGPTRAENMLQRILFLLLFDPSIEETKLRNNSEETKND